jgi:enoyl-CoA hydratase
MPDVIYEAKPPVATAIINRPEQRNALSNEVLAALREAVADARHDPQVRALVLAGAGDRAFCAGGDLHQMSEHPSAAHDQRGELASLFLDLWSLGKPTIARVQGYALAGGMGLALACDFVVASAVAQFGVPEVRVGLWPYMITLPLLRSMPEKTALGLMLTGRRVSAAEGASIGFVTHLVAPGDLDDAIDELVEQLAHAGPTATRMGRSVFHSLCTRDAETSLKMLQAHLTVSLGTEEAREGIRAFQERREPAWILSRQSAAVDSNPAGA